MKCIWDAPVCKTACNWSAMGDMSIFPGASWCCVTEGIQSRTFEEHTTQSCIMRIFQLMLWSISTACDFSTPYHQKREGTKLPLRSEPQAWVGIRLLSSVWLAHVVQEWQRLPEPPLPLSLAPNSNISKVCFSRKHVNLGLIAPLIPEYLLCSRSGCVLWLYAQCKQGVSPLCLGHG